MSGSSIGYDGTAHIAAAGETLRHALNCLAISAPDWLRPGARSLGVYRFWRDLGYAIGALLAGVVADLLGMYWAIGIVGGLTLCSGIVTALTMRETAKKR